MLYRFMSGFMLALRPVHTTSDTYSRIVGMSNDATNLRIAQFYANNEWLLGVAPYRSSGAHFIHLLLVMLVTVEFVYNYYKQPAF